MYYTHLHTHLHARAHTHIHTRTHRLARTHTHTSTRTKTHTQILARTQSHTHSSVCTTQEDTKRKEQAERDREKRSKKKVSRLAVLIVWQESLHGCVVFVWESAWLCGVCMRVCTLMLDLHGNSQRRLTEKMPENAHYCIQKAATHSHLIWLTSFEYQIVAGIESYPSMCPVLCGSLCVLR
jgi:ferredoxin